MRDLEIGQVLNEMLSAPPFIQVTYSLMPKLDRAKHLELLRNRLDEVIRLLDSSQLEYKMLTVFHSHGSHFKIPVSLDTIHFVFTFLDKYSAQIDTEETIQQISQLISELDLESQIVVSQEVYKLIVENSRKYKGLSFRDKLFYSNSDFF